MSAQDTSISKGSGKDELWKRGLALATFIIFWDAIEGIVSITAGILANSIALIGFGLDSGIEVVAAASTVWYMRSKKEGQYKAALRIISLTFFALAVYVSYNSINDLINQSEALPSVIGIAINVVALFVMIPTALMQKRVGRTLNNHVIISQSNETWLSNYLSISLIVGLGANILFGWWWADPLIALLLAAVAVYEGIEAWRESGEEEPD